jgi:amino-acid N-acetyltransferase
MADFLAGFVVLEQAGEVVGAAGIELYGEAGFLRSVVVTSLLRGTGQADRLVLAALDYAKQNGARRVYLFTMNAGNFFARHGFQAVKMDDFELPVRETWQYAALSRMPEMAKLLTPMRMELS